MSLNRHANAYKSAELENAPPLKIVRMLYHGCLRFIDQAAASHEAGDFPKFNQYVGRAEAIISELRSSLDRDQAPELVDQLEGLYLFTFSRLIESIAGADLKPLGEAREVIEILLDAWNQLNVAQAS